MTDLTPELELVLACVRHRFGRPARRPTARSVDWDQFAALVSDEGLAPLVAPGVDALEIALPESMRHELQAASAATALRFKFGYEPALARTLKVLNASGLQPIVLKGAALAYTAFLRSSDRTMSDIDVLLPFAHHARAGRALQQAGFGTLDIPSRHGHHHGPPYVSPGEQVCIELHHDLVPAANPYAVDVAALSARAELRRLAGVEARVFAAHDALLHVCIHLALGHRYQWYPLRTLTDILALTTLPTIDWRLFIQTTLGSRTAGAVYWPLRLSHDWLDAPIPTDVLARLAPPPALKRVIEAVLVSTPYVLDRRAPSASGAGVLYSLIRELSLYTGCPRREQLAALVRTLFPPPDAVAHRPTSSNNSRIRYAASLLSPARIFRGALAAVRLVAHLPATQTSKGAAPR